MFTFQTDYDMIDYLNELRDGCLESYTGMVQGLKGDAETPSGKIFYYFRSLTLEVSISPWSSTHNAKQSLCFQSEAPQLRSQHSRNLIAVDGTSDMMQKKERKNVKYFEKSCHKNVHFKLFCFSLYS